MNEHTENDHTDLLMPALLMIEQGMPVFLGRPNARYGTPGENGKPDPREFHLPARWQDLAADTSVIDAWNPGDALCLATGHGLDAVDIDPRHGSDVEEQRHRLVTLGVPIIGETRTPGGGAHFYVPSVGLCSSSNTTTGVDFRGRGMDGGGAGLLYLPATQRPKYDGGGYTWVTTPKWEDLDDLDDNDRNEIRDALAAYLYGVGITPRIRDERSSVEVIGGVHVDHERLPTWLRTLITDTGPEWETASGVPSRDRSERFHNLVGACRRAHLTQAETVTVLEPWTEAVGKYVGRVADEVARSWPKVAPTNEGDAMSDHTPPDALADNAEENEEEVEWSSWRPVDLTAHLDGTYVPPEATIMPRTDGVHLVYPGRLHSFHGESESGKSLILQAEMVRALRAGQRVLLLDFEDDASSVVPRMLRMGATAEDLRERFTYVRPDGGPGTEDGRRAWAALLAERYDLAVIDGVTDAYSMWTAGASSSDNDALAAFLRTFPRRLARETGAAVCLIDHVRKEADGRGRFALGGVAKMNALNGAAYVVEVEQMCGIGLRGVLSLRIGKDRPGVIRPDCGAWRKSDRTQEAARIVVDSTQADTTVVTVEPPRVNDPGAAFRPTTLMERVSRLLETEPEPLSTRRVREGVKGKVEAIDDAVRVLVAEGYVTVTKSGQANLHTSTKPYRAEEDPESDAYLGSLTDTTVSGTRSSTTSTNADRNPTVTVSPLIGGGHGTRLGEEDSTVSGTRLGHGEDTVGIWDLDDPRNTTAGAAHACAGEECRTAGCMAGTAASA